MSIINALLARRLTEDRARSALPRARVRALPPKPTVRQLAPFRR
jgi:hypothetical protein